MKAQFHLGNSPCRAWLKLGLVAGLIVGLDATIGTALAKSPRSYRSEPEKQPEEPAPPAGPLFIVISTGKQTISVYGRDGLYVRGPVSTGQPGHPTPLGVFTILAKELYHASNIYSGAPMPFMQRVTYSGVAMHEGVLPGYPASHGCIRLPHELAKRLYSYTKGNERVIISRADIIPVDISHPRLWAPKFMATPGSNNIASGSVQILQNAIRTASRETESAVRADGSDAPSNVDGQPLLNPLEYAKSMQQKAAKDAEEAAVAVGPLQKVADAKAREAQAAALELKKAELIYANAKSQLDYADRILRAASGEKAIETATAAKTAAEAKLREAEAALETAKRTKAIKSDDAATAMAAFKTAENLRRASASAVRSWNRRLEPLSILISRKAQRLYVRQAYTKVFDVPITIREPEKPIGTHLFVAMPPTKEQPQSVLRWLVLTFPEGTADDDRGTRRRRSRYSDEDDDAPRVAAPPVSASEALNRIEVPDFVAAKISEMLWAGSSIIISDADVSKETEYYALTDLTVLMR